MHEEMISVIIPCYNVSKYISKCIESILNQSYKKLEIIMVDDCSTDDTCKVLEKYSLIDSRIKVLKNDNNMGAAYSRNRGFSESHGNFISFIDSDDYIDDNFYESMINKLLENNADVSVCDIKVFYEENNKEVISKCFDGEDISIINVIKSGLVASSSNKLFRRHLIKNYHYPEGIINEDIPVVIPALLNAKNIVYVDNTYYHYIQRNDSVQNSKFSLKKFDIIKSLELTFKIIENVDNYQEFREILIYNQIINLLIYDIVRVKSFFERYKVLLNYYELTKSYDLSSNKYFLDYIDKLDKSHKIYYRKIVKSFSKRRIFITDLFISIHNILSKLSRHK